MKERFLSQFGYDDARTVSEYTRQIKQLLEGSIAPGWVTGEVSNFRRQASGHLYFSLKDGTSQLPVVMFRGNAAGLDFELENGAEVIVYGEISVFEPYGRYQLIARAAVQAGQGKLHREFERLKRKLLEEGLFDKARKKSLPLAPRSIAFITSPSGAAVQDFIRILKRRDWRGHLTVLPAKVQGADAAETLLESLALAEKLARFDLIVIGRGGGSLEDLWCFNDERLVRALATLSVPVISAVGHEIDFTLSDFVADVRAETPSAAAELISSSYIDCANRLEFARDSLDDSVSESILAWRRELGDWGSRLKAVAPERNLETASLRLDEISGRIEVAITREIGKTRRNLAEGSIGFGNLRPERVVENLRKRLNSLEERSRRETDRRMLPLRQRHGELSAKLRTLSPDSTLKRGYAILSKADGRMIASVASIAENERVRATLADGESWLRKDASGEDDSVSV